MRLLRLILRRKLAYELLDEYDREPLDLHKSMRRLEAYHTETAANYDSGFAAGAKIASAERWSEIARRRAKDWPE